MRVRTSSIILAVFFLSGACTLIYEIVWARMFVLVFGTSVYAVSTVLTAFMAGLALGSALFGRLIDRGGSALRVYAWLELGIALFALVFPLLLAGLDDLYTLLYRRVGAEGYVFTLVRFLLGFLVLLVPTTLMGGTLPVLSKFFVRGADRVGSGVGRLYAVNTFGATAGALLAAFVMMEQLGIRGATWVAAATNVILAGVCFWLARSAAGERREAAPAGGPPPGRETAARGDGRAAITARLVFWGFALSGVAALGYQVVWTRLLAVVLSLTTAQSFSIILVAFLFGLAAGGTVGARLADRWRHPLRAFALVELSLGLLGLASIAIFGRIPEIYRALVLPPSWWGYLAKLVLVSWGIMLVPTFLMGLLFPLVGKVHARRMASLGRRIGDVYAVNTAGAILGAFAAGFLLIPFLGTQRSLIVLGALNLLVGAAVWLSDRSTRAVPRFGLVAVVALPALLLALLPPGTFLTDLFQRARPGAELLHCDEDAGGTVTVYEFKNGNRVLRVNGAGEVPTDRASIETFQLLGNLPMLVHPSPEEVLVIAFGGGITLSAVDAQQPRRIDCVEVAPGVVGAAPHFARFNNGVYERLEAGRIELVFDDGRNHVLRTERSYDVIISDSTHPGTADSWVLYTDEFYRLCQAKLKPGGVMAQWLPLHGLTADGYKIILRTFRGVFPAASLWVTEGYSVLLGTPERLSIDPARVRARLESKGVAETLDAVGLGDPVSFLATLALDEESLGWYAGDGPVNTDDRPWVSFASRMRSGAGGDVPVMMSLLPFLGDRAAHYLDDGIFAERDALVRRQRARKETFSAGVAWRTGARERALQHLGRARQIDPTEPGAARMLRRIERSRGRR